MRSDDQERAGRMALLAKADPAVLEAAWERIAPRPAVRWLRPAEVGMAMVRGRAGGTGAAFNLGEMTMTRAVARLEGGQTGFGYVAGRDRRHAELAALFDGLLQDAAWRERLAELLARLARDHAAAREARAARVAPTRVDFATMVRGDA